MPTGLHCKTDFVWTCLALNDVEQAEISEDECVEFLS